MPTAASSTRRRLQARHAAAATGATAADKIDTFTIKGTDANGRSITVATVTVNILSLNNVPTGGTANFPAASANGVISGSLTGVTDADNDTLTYSGAAGKGDVVFTGTSFTYTPHADGTARRRRRQREYRHQAGHHHAHRRRRPRRREDVQQRGVQHHDRRTPLRPTRSPALPVAGLLGVDEDLDHQRPATPTSTLSTTRSRHSRPGSTCQWYSATS